MLAFLIEIYYHLVMKKFIICAVVIMLIVALVLFAGGSIEPIRVGLDGSIGSGSNDEITLPFKVKASELYSRPDIILECYKNAYPDTIKDVIEQNGDWTLTLFDGTVFYWAEGRMLTEEMRDSWEDYRPYQVWAYSGETRNPDAYTAEDIARLRERTAQDVRGAPQPPLNDEFLRALFGVGSRLETEQNLVKTSLFGKTVTVNRVVASKFPVIDAAVTEIAKTDNEVKEFLDTLSEVSGYSWRAVEGTNRLSNHSYGLAVDVLPRGWGNKMMYWAWVRDFNDDWMLVPQEDLWTPPEKVVQVMKDNGFTWGGTWVIYDTMHFEYKPELIEISKRVIFD